MKLTEPRYIHIIFQINEDYWVGVFKGFADGTPMYDWKFKAGSLQIALVVAKELDRVYPAQLDIDGYIKTLNRKGKA
jgi:hypothetical protein